MAVLYDARGNEMQNQLDGITGQTLTDARVSAATLGALNADALVDLNGKTDVMVDLRSGAFSGTVVFEGTVNGTDYIALPGWMPAAETMLASVVVTTTHAQQYAVNVAGFRRFRVRVSAFTSGTITVAMRATTADNMIYVRPIPSTLAVSVTAAANTALTATLPAAGAGLFHYITAILMSRNATAALAGGATLVHTTTNMPGSLGWSVGNAMAAGGTQVDVDRVFPNPLKSSAANTATTFVMPAAGLAVLNRINVVYYVAG